MAHGIPTHFFYRILLLLACSLHVGAARVKSHSKTKSTRIHHQNEAVGSNDKASAHKALAATPEYWSTNEGSWKPVGLINHQHTQQFEVLEEHGKTHFWDTRKYTANLTCNEPICNEYRVDPNTGAEITSNMNAEVMTVNDYHFTMHGDKWVKIKSRSGETTHQYQLHKPQLIGRYFTWNIGNATHSETKFTIELNNYDMSHCDFGFMSCRPVMKIWVGDVNNWTDNATLIYYGIGEKELGRPDFRFYHSVATYSQHKTWESERATYEEDQMWAAQIQHKQYNASTDDDKYVVKVKPGEDAGLILLATICLDVIAAGKRPESFSG